MERKHHIDMDKAIFIHRGEGYFFIMFLIMTVVIIDTDTKTESDKLPVQGSGSFNLLVTDIKKEDNGTFICQVARIIFGIYHLYETDEIEVFPLPGEHGAEHQPGERGFLDGFIGIGVVRLCLSFVNAIKANRRLYIGERGNGVSYRCYASTS